MPVGVDAVFAAQAQELTATAALAGAQPLAAGARRAWMLPDPGAWSGNPLALRGESGLKLAFDQSGLGGREILNNLYRAAVTLTDDAVEGRLSDRMVAKIQVDYLAVMERALRARHATSVRCAYLAAGRKLGQGSSSGTFSTVVNYIAGLTAEGYQDQKQPLS